MKNYPETELTIAVADYLRLQYPKVTFTHVANERYTNKRQNKKTGKWYSPMGQILKNMGQRKGWPDMMIIKKKKHNGVIMFGIAMELKTKGNSVSPEQKEVLLELESEGMITAICYDFGSAKKVIDGYLKQ